MIHELMPRAVLREQGAEASAAGGRRTTTPHWPPGTDANLEWNAGFKGEQYKPAATAERN
jgi:hypothetical protein